MLDYVILYHIVYIYICILCYLHVFVHISVLLICPSMCIYITQSCADKCIYAIMFPFRYTHIQIYIYIYIFAYKYVYIYICIGMHIYNTYICTDVWSWAFLVFTIYSLLFTVWWPFSIPSGARLTTAPRFGASFEKSRCQRLRKYPLGDVLQWRIPWKKPFGFNNLGNLEAALFWETSICL